MEMERRPAAARRVMDSPRRATAAPPVPALDDSVVARLEASRRVRAARRLGLFQTLPSDAECVVEAEVPLALPFASTAAAEMERRRRPRAAAGRAPVSSLPAVDAASAASPGAALADTACARSERARRPRAAARADALARLTAPRSILHPELVGAFAAERDAERDAARDAERAFAAWRSNGGWTADEKDSLATTSNDSLEMDAPEFLKSSASARTPRLETDPFAALERMLETRLRVPERCASSPRAAGGSGTTSRGGSTRGASACSSAFTRAPRSRSSLNGHGSSADLEREGSTFRGNAVPRRVRCSLENADVVCRVDDSDEVVERVARDSVEAKITALAETLERERLSAPPPVSR